MVEQTTTNRMRALVLAPSFSTEMNANRPLSAACVLSEIAEVEVVTADFDHWTKKKRIHRQVPPIHKITYLRTLPYNSNVGICRLISHSLLSLSATLYFLQHRKRFDIVYATLPFNTLAWLAFRSAGRRFKIVDVTDIWPDVLPFSPYMVQLFRPVFALWRRFFNKAVASADVMMAVSDSFFQETLKYTSDACVSRRFYLGEVNLRTKVPKNETLTIAYSGNIGRLYDFETLLEVMASAQPGSVELHIIGDGDRKDWLLQELDRKNVKYKYFGSVYDPDKLSDILCRAHLGFNGYVNTSAAFSTKASTYFAAGLPILNSMKGDLENLVIQHRLGFNYRGGDATSLSECFRQIDYRLIEKMSENCSCFFSSELDRTKLRQDMHNFLRSCLFSSRTR